MIALFSGGGGLHLGLEQAGLKLIAASDIAPGAEATHLRNQEEIPFLRGDIRTLTSNDFLKVTGGIRPDIIVGGPPCQGFSTLGDKLSGDPRNVLFNAYANLVADLDPRFILIENVKSLVTMYGGKFKDSILKTFSHLGYRMYWKVLDAADYGVPQFRKRVIFFGTKENGAFTFPKPTHGPNHSSAYNTTWAAISDLAEKGTEVPNHIALNHSEIVTSRYKMIEEGGKLPPPEALPIRLRRKNFGNTYKRLHRDLPSLTMVPGNNAFPVHPTLDRSLTPREAARLQTFPDSRIFVGDRRTQCILVGNAVPPVLAEALGKAILKHVNAADAIGDDNKADQAFAHDNTVNFPKKKVSKKDGFIDLFSGAGGFSIGMERAGWRPLASADNNKYVAKTHASNHPQMPFVMGDLADPDVRSRVIACADGEDIGLVVGGPPCQGFSIFGKRRFVNTKGYEPSSDDRNKLVYAFIDTVRQINPRWFVMENVQGLANLDKGLFLERVLEKFRSIGFDTVEAKLLNAADYGVPQLRKRLIIIGNRTGHIIPWPKKKFFPEPKDWQDKYRGVGEVLSDLAHDRSQEVQSCHVPMKHKPLLVERYKYIPEGGKLDVEALPEHLKSGYRTKEVRNYSHVFKRLHRDRPAMTMVPGHNAFPIHPWLNRALTVREAARIQTFPDDITFEGPRQEQCIQVGNAFPPLLAEIIGNCIKKAEVNGWYPGTVPPSAYYSLIEAEQSEAVDTERRRKISVG
ncbi:DNA cytosine methyltransferase [Altererythrobacter aquiaggeris]|uniref:DNA cytosine methyltransferase n=1 Tax=Aestuarierythrobacter aquiaggeris TaxID=1898396 RepID=UPI003018727F